MVSNLLPEATSYPALISNKQLRQNSHSSLTDATNGREYFTATAWTGQKTAMLELEFKARDRGISGQGYS